MDVWCSVSCVEIPVGDAPDYYRCYDDNESLSDYDDFHMITIHYYTGSRIQVFKGFWGYTRYEYGLMWHSSQDTAEEPVFSVGQQMIYYHSKEMEARFRSICDIRIISEAFYRYQTRGQLSDSEGPGAEESGTEESGTEELSTEEPVSEGPRKRAKHA